MGQTFLGLVLYTVCARGHAEVRRTRCPSVGARAAPAGWLAAPPDHLIYGGVKVEAGRRHERFI